MAYRAPEVETPQSVRVASSSASSSGARGWAVAGMPWTHDSRRAIRAGVPSRRYLQMPRLAVFGAARVVMPESGRVPCMVRGTWVHARPSGGKGGGMCMHPCPASGSSPETPLPLRPSPPSSLRGVFRNSYSWSVPLRLARCSRETNGDERAAPGAGSVGDDDTRGPCAKRPRDRDETGARGGGRERRGKRAVGDGPGVVAVCSPPARARAPWRDGSMACLGSHWPAAGPAPGERAGLGARRGRPACVPLPRPLLSRARHSLASRGKKKKY